MEDEYSLIELTWIGKKRGNLGGGGFLSPGSFLIRNLTGEEPDEADGEI